MSTNRYSQNWLLFNKTKPVSKRNIRRSKTFFRTLTNLASKKRFCFFYCKAMWNLRRFYYLFWFNLIKGKANSFWYTVWLSNIHPQFMAAACRIGCLKRLTFKLGKKFSQRQVGFDAQCTWDIKALPQRPSLICFSTSNYVTNFENGGIKWNVH